MRLIPEDELEIQTIYENLKQINKNYVNENDLNGDGFVYDDQSAEEEGQFDDAEE